MLSAGLNLKANPRHPDFKGCIAAWPMADGPLSMRNAVSSRYKLTATNGSRQAMRTGMGYKNLTSLTYSTTDAFPNWGTAGLSWLIRFQQDTTGGFPREIFEESQVIFMTEIARQVSWYNTAGTQLAVGTRTITLGQEYALGIRYDGGSQVTFFINGTKETITSGGGPFSGTGSALSVSGGTFRNQGTGYIRDIRIYHKAMPDATFERYYTDPNSFYLFPRRYWRGITFNASRFMPFMHPALQS